MNKKEAIALIKTAGADYAAGREKIQQALVVLMELAAEHGNTKFYLGDAYSEFADLGAFVKKQVKTWLMKHCGMVEAEGAITWAKPAELAENLAKAKEDKWWGAKINGAKSFDLEKEVNALVKKAETNRKARAKLEKAKEAAKDEAELAEVQAKLDNISLDLSPGAVAALKAALGIGEAIAEMMEDEE